MSYPVLLNATAENWMVVSPEILRDYRLYPASLRDLEMVPTQDRADIKLWRPLPGTNAKNLTGALTPLAVNAPVKFMVPGSDHHPGEIALTK
jgi:hypothetical protein